MTLQNLTEVLNSGYMLHNELKKLGFVLENPIENVYYYCKNMQDISIYIKDIDNYEVDVFDYVNNTEKNYRFHKYCETISFIIGVIRKERIRKLLEK